MLNTLFFRDFSTKKKFSTTKAKEKLCIMNILLSDNDRKENGNGRIKSQQLLHTISRPVGGEDGAK